MDDDLWPDGQAELPYQLANLYSDDDWTPYEISTQSVTPLQGQKTDDQDRDIMTPPALPETEGPSSDGIKDTVTENSHSSHSDRSVSGTSLAVPSYLGPMSTTWTLPLSDNRKLGPGTRSNQTRTDAVLEARGQRKKTTSSEPKTVRVLLMSDTGETHTMPLNESGKYFCEASTPNWLQPKIIERSDTGDSQTYLAIPLTAGGQASSKHTSPPTCSGEFSAARKAAKGRKRKEIMPEKWPEEWQPSKWKS